MTLNTPSFWRIQARMDVFVAAAMFTMLLGQYFLEQFMFLISLLHIVVYLVVLCGISYRMNPSHASFYGAIILATHLVYLIFTTISATFAWWLLPDEHQRDLQWWLLFGGFTIGMVLMVAIKRRSHPYPLRRPHG